jgi:thiol:disulfide interchange protein
MPPASERPLTGSSRATPPLLLGIAVALLILRVAAVLYGSRHPSRAVDLVEWRPAEEAVALARSLGRPILYGFTADWRGPCQAMARDVFADRQAAREISRLFVPVRVLDRAREAGRNTPDVAALQARYHVRAFPTLVIASPDGGDPVVIEGYPGRSALLRQLARAGVRTRVNLRLGPQGMKADSTR